MSLRFFADHSIPNFIIKTLCDSGYEVFQLRFRLFYQGRFRVYRVTSSESFQLNKGCRIYSPDPIILKKAQTLDAIFLSLDEDFVDIERYPPGEYKGIIALQVKNRPEVIPELMARLKSHLAAYPLMNHYQGKLVLIEVDGIKIVE